MNKKEQLGQQVLENTIKVIMNLPEHETMVIGTQELTKKEIIKKFWEDEKFQFEISTQLDKSVKKFLFRGQPKRKDTDGS